MPFQIGDKVRVKPHQRRCAFPGFLGANGDFHPSPDAGKVGWVTSAAADVSMARALTTISTYVACPNDTVVVRILEEGDYKAENIRLPVELLELVEAGNGHLIIGETCPASPRELREGRLADFRRKLVKAEEARGEGWSNAATFLAYTYLSQSNVAACEAARRRRKDGSIHPDKLHDVYEVMSQRGVIPVVDDWAFEPALEIPAEFDHLANLRPSIQWREICAYMKKLYDEELRNA